MRVILLIACLICSSIAFAQDWSTIGGNASRNGFVETVGPTHARVLWEGTSLEATTANQTYIANGRVVTTRRQSNQYAPLVCHDLYTGELLWVRDLTGQTSQTLPIGFRQETVYALRTDRKADTLYALHAATGAIKWRSSVPLRCSHASSAAFTPEGDLIVEGEEGLLVRIDHRTGQRLWATKCDPMARGELHPTIGGRWAYVWEWATYPNQAVSMIDLETGRKVATQVIPSRSKMIAFVQTPITVGPDGTVYAYKQRDRLVALRNTGTALQTLWETPILGNSAYSQMACGPDGSVYIPHNGKIVRLNSRNGHMMDSTRTLVRSAAGGISARMAVDAMGTVFVSVAEFPTGMVYAFTPNLKQHWAHEVEGLHLSGPALSSEGLLSVAGSGQWLIVFQSDQYIATGGQLASERKYNLTLTPSPANSVSKLNYSLPQSQDIRIKLHDLAGKPVKTWKFNKQEAGEHEVSLEIPEIKVSAGTYILTFETEEGETIRKRVTKQTE
ncbi:Por secretion system C-terminal sorting domain-containing protein [Catalinimonas alkaloidigena]|uniref:Por secretion system C-terminal sorting domain-containing protein n=1 Tax=Catalinimonas alkaloidigena TaxID=1075417 RepID=A0A1G9MYD4_9BACT|nr:PQQ-binding-like beta-propeller repeat protein [Catalinimonas alkaloidigena]SDL78615.1 Por secretion system C-terminal sorting domain-containing protein [Catalinimonas alkaloidigena]